MSYNSDTLLINYVSKYIGYTFYSENQKNFMVFCVINAAAKICFDSFSIHIRLSGLRAS